MKAMKAERRAPTAAEKRAIHARQNGACFIDGCAKPIAVFEHWTMVAIGNDAAPDCGLCEDHANIKTYGGKDDLMWRAPGGDIRDIWHAKRLAGEVGSQQARRAERKAEGKRSLIQGKTKIEGRGFQKSLRKKMSGEVVKR